MSFSRQGTAAYQAASELRSTREQEADVFRRALGALRNSRAGSGTEQARALSDNRRLWTTVVDLMRDPANALPEPTRAGIVSLGMAVQREMKAAAPDFGFLISINETMAAGLSGQG